MAYPDVTNNQKITIKKGSLRSFANSSSVESGLLILDRESMQTEALCVYLTCYRDKLCNLELSSDCNIEQTTQEMVGIYFMLSNTLVGASDENFRGTWRSTWPCKELPMVQFSVLQVLL